MLVNSTDIQELGELTKQQSQNIMMMLKDKVPVVYKMCESNCGNRYRTVKGMISRPYINVDDAITFFSRSDPRGFIQRSRAKHLKIFKKIKKQFLEE